MQLAAAGAIVGGGLGLAGAKLADILPRRYGICQLAPEKTRRLRTRALVALGAAISAGIGHVLAAADVAPSSVAFLLAVNATIVALVLSAAAIDLEHMILPNELTLGAAVLALVSSPLRNVGPVGALAGAAIGFALTYLPFLLYKKIKGQSGMGLGDAKLAITAGAWHGIEGAVFVLFAGALQSVLAAAIMRLTGVKYTIPASVRAELADLRARAAAGDALAAAELADDPMAAEEQAGTLAMRLPLGPFLAAACIETLFLRRWLLEHVFAWLRS